MSTESFPFFSPRVRLVLGDLMAITGAFEALGVFIETTRRRRFKVDQITASSRAGSSLFILGIDKIDL